jgi:uncharacterized Fe-S cluster-containing protein
MKHNSQCCEGIQFAGKKLGIQVLMTGTQVDIILLKLAQESNCRTSLFIMKIMKTGQDIRWENCENLMSKWD